MVDYPLNRVVFVWLSLLPLAWQADLFRFLVNKTTPAPAPAPATKKAL